MQTPTTLQHGCRRLASPPHSPPHQPSTHPSGTPLPPQEPPYQSPTHSLTQQPPQAQPHHTAPSGGLGKQPPQRTHHPTIQRQARAAAPPRYPPHRHRTNEAEKPHGRCAHPPLAATPPGRWGRRCRRGRRRFHRRDTARQAGVLDKGGRGVCTPRSRTQGGEVVDRVGGVAAFGARRGGLSGGGGGGCVSRWC